MKEPAKGLFLERRIYRQRRLIDAVKMLPVLAACLFVFPALVVDEDATTAARLIYFLITWGSLILLAAILANRLRAGERDETTKDDRGEG